MNALLIRNLRIRIVDQFGRRQGDEVRVMPALPSIQTEP
jgi:hypothetical protein